MSAAAEPRAGLVARTRVIDPPTDVLDELGPDGFAWLHDGVGFVTAGTAARVSPDAAAAELSRIEVDDPVGLPGTGALAVGALGFGPSPPQAEPLVIPATVVGRTGDGRAWVTHIGPTLRIPPAPGLAPSRFTVEAESSRAAWHDAVTEVLDAIRAGHLAKAVLARSVSVTADAPFSPQAVLQRLRSTQPGCFVFAAEGFVGASPELLVRRRGTSVESRPMAGTVGLVDPGAEARLNGSAKDAHEHRLVVDAVLEALGPSCADIVADPVPVVTRFADIAHLVTRVRGHLSRPVSALGLARDLHPTPAVAGTPRDVATGMITALEPVARDRYAGPVGWVDGRGDGEWVVGLRSGQLDGARARLWAGAGIVTGSDPDLEWAETELKLEPMLRALVRP